MHYLQNGAEKSPGQSKNTKHITIVFAMEQTLLRQNLVALLDADPQFQVIGEVNNGLDALDMVNNLDPDILVFGLSGSDTQDIIRLVNSRHPTTAVIVINNVENERQTTELLGSGVKAHILKKLDIKKLVEAIHYVNASSINLSSISPSPAVSNQVRSGADNIRDPIETLTSREREVLDLIISEMTNAQIANQLSISRRTVEIHRARIIAKLGLKNQYQQIITYAAERGILPK